MIEFGNHFGILRPTLKTRKVSKSKGWNTDEHHKNIHLRFFFQNDALWYPFSLNKWGFILGPFTSERIVDIDWCSSGNKMALGKMCPGKMPDFGSVKSLKGMMARVSCWKGWWDFCHFEQLGKFCQKSTKNTGERLERWASRKPASCQRNSSKSHIWTQYVKMPKGISGTQHLSSWSCHCYKVVFENARFFKAVCQVHQIYQVNWSCFPVSNINQTEKTWKNTIEQPSSRYRFKTRLLNFLNAIPTWHARINAFLKRCGSAKDLPALFCRKAKKLSCPLLRNSFGKRSVSDNTLQP